MMRVSAVLLVLTSALSLAGPLLAQVAPPVDGTPATNGATTSTTTTAPAAPATTPAAAGSTTPGIGTPGIGTPAGVPLPAPPGVITIVISPDLLQWILQALTAMGQQPGAPGAALPPLPPLAPAPLPGPGGTAAAPGGGAYTPKKNEQPVAGFPLIVVKGKKLIRTGPGLAQAMAFIQAGDQASAVNVLGQTLAQVQAAAQQNAKLRPGKQAAATQSAYQIGQQTLTPGAVPLAPATGAAAPTSAVTVTAADTTPPPAANGQGGPPPDGKTPPPLPPGPIVPPATPAKGAPMNCSPVFANAVAGAQKQASPIVLDLNGNGVADVTSPDVTGNTGAFNPRGAVRFDLSGQGTALKFEWLKPEADGLLVLDSNGNGVVDNATELFGDAEGFNDGYAKLAILDRNHDGKLEGDELSHLSVWIDDGDGQCQPGELHSLASLGITRIDVRHSNYRSTFVRNGKTYSTWDWFPRSE